MGHASCRGSLSSKVEVNSSRSSAYYLSFMRPPSNACELFDTSHAATDILLSNLSQISTARFFSPIQHQSPEKYANIRSIQLVLHFHLTSMAVSLDVLLSAHKEDIGALRVALGDSLPANWDDVWLLRYCLSFQDAAERVGAVRSCIGYRSKYAAMLGDASAGRPPPHESKIRPYMVQGFHGCSRLGEPLFIVRAGVSSPPSLVEAVPPAEILEWLMYFKEVGESCYIVTSSRPQTPCPFRNSLTLCSISALRRRESGSANPRQDDKRCRHGTRAPRQHRQALLCRLGRV